MARRTIVGVEITQESVRAAEITTGAFPTLVAFGEVALPAGAASDSLVRDRDAVSAALEELWQSSGITGRHAILAVGGAPVLVREVTVDAASPESIVASLSDSVRRLLPADPAHTVTDFYRLSDDEGAQTRGILVAVAEDTVERILASFARTRAHVRSIDLAAFGLARIAGRLGHPGETTMTVHIGDHTTHIVIAVGGVPRLIRMLRADVRTSAVTRSVAAARETPSAVAVITDPDGRSGLRIGGAAERTRPKAGGGTIDPAALADRIRRIAHAFRQRPGGTRIGSVFVSGAGFASPGMEPALSAALKRPVRPLGVEQIVSTRAVRPDGDTALDLVVPIGIVLGDPR